MAFVEINISDLVIFNERLGTGATGSVYKAKWKNQIVAVKKLSLSNRQEALKEAEVLSSLRHRNIIQFYGIAIASPDYCLVTEYAELGSLYDYLKINPIDFQQAIVWAKQIAMGMNYLHHETPISVIHRDLKSNNVVISKDLTAKVCDFGSAKLFDHTTYMTRVITFKWTAPEVFRGDKISTACDVYSYSVILWEMLTRETPFKGENMYRIVTLVGEGKRLTIPEWCPPTFSNLIQHCWSEEPKDRPTFRDILNILENMMTKESLKEETEKFLKNKDVLKEDKPKLKELKTKEWHQSQKQRKLEKKEKEQNSGSDGRAQLRQRPSHDTASSNKSNRTTDLTRETSNLLPPSTSMYRTWLYMCLGIFLFVSIIGMDFLEFKPRSDTCGLEDQNDLHIASKESLQINGNKPQLLNWEKYGLRIRISEGSLPSTETAEVTVAALVGGQFVFPENTILVSAVYAVSVSRPLLKPIRLEIQHCVNITAEPGVSSYLKFAIAPISKPGLPYHFSLVDGGEFNEMNWYGSINRREFCLVSIMGIESNGREEKQEKALTTGTRISESMTYIGILYHFHVKRNLNITFIATKKLDALIEYSKQYAKADRQWTVPFRFRNYIELILCEDQTIQLHVNEPCKLDKEFIDSFGALDVECPIHPKCTLNASNVSNFYAVSLEGILHPATLSMNIELRPPVQKGEESDYVELPQANWPIIFVSIIFFFGLVLGVLSTSRYQCIGLVLFGVLIYLLGKHF